MRNDICRVCGLEQGMQPWGADGRTPSFDICDCCGVEFGYEDATSAGVLAHRREWLDGGASWFKPSHRPRDWNLAEQLARVLEGPQS